MQPFPAKISSGDASHAAPGLTLMAALVSFAVICCILYFGRDVIVPVVLAILLSMLLTPVIVALQRVHVPRAVAILGLVALVSVGLLLGATAIGKTLTGLANDLPVYETNLRDKAHGIRLLAAGGSIDRAANVLRDLQAELAITSPQHAAAADTGKPIPVEVQDQNLGPLQAIVSVIGVAIHPIAQLGIVLLLVCFILFNREELRNRIIHLAGPYDLHRTTAAIDDAGKRITHLFWMQLLINLSAGTVIGVGLSLLGIPGGPLWGLLTAILRFIPYIGPWMSAVFPILIALAIGDGWGLALVTAGFVLVTEIIAGQIAEPLLFGRTTGLSPVAIIASLAFWAALWGPVGLVLATPITVGLLVLARNIEAFNILEVMLGSGPALTPDYVFYQRLLAEDPIEAAELASAFEKDKKLDVFIANVAVPALLLAQRDQARGALEKWRRVALVQTFSEALDDVLTPGSAAAGPDAAILLVSAHGTLNFAATLAFSAYLKVHGIVHEVLPEESVQRGKFPAMDSPAPRTVCLCYLTAPAASQSDYAIRRIARQSGDARVIVVAWEGTESRKDILGPEESRIAMASMSEGEMPVSAAGAS